MRPAQPSATPFGSSEPSGHSTATVTDQAVLVAVELTGERRRQLGQARLARRASSVTAATLDELDAPADAETPPTPEDPIPELDFDAALDEFQELARSAGVTVHATVIQRRPRADAATLIGPGKVEELEAVVKSHRRKRRPLRPRPQPLPDAQSQRRPSPAASSTEPSSSSTSSPSTPAPARATSR